MRRRETAAKYGPCLILLLFGIGISIVGLIGRSGATVPGDPFLGIPPQDVEYYKVFSSSDDARIKCRGDGSKKTFTKAQLNDDFCDCPDGTDEPGTSACPRGKFYCRNAGHTSLFVFSSRVNDGICDCCDGSDEYNGQVNCNNTCWEAGKVARDKLKKKIATYKEGVTLRKREVQQAKIALAKDEAQLSMLKEEESLLKDLVQQLKERKEQIDKAEEKERLRKEKEDKERKDAEEKAGKEQGEEQVKRQKDQSEENAESEEKPLGNAHDDEQIGTFDDTYPDQDEEAEHVDPVIEDEHSDDSGVKASPDVIAEKHILKEEKESVSASNDKDDTVGMCEADSHDRDNSAGACGADHVTSSEVSPDSVRVENDVAENTEGLSKEELGRFVASRWTGNTEKQNEGVDGAKDNDHEDEEDHEEMPVDTHDEDYDGYASENDDDSGKYDDADVEDDTDDAYGEDSSHDATSSYNHESDDEPVVSDITSPSNPSWLEKIQLTVRNILQAVNLFQTPVNVSDATFVRKEYEESSTKLTKLQSRISSLTQKLKHDFGVDKEFYSFYDQCFEGKQNKYVYKICPFKHASQIEGHSTTRLGRWDKFEDSYRVMLFSNGDKCWNGPDRSLKVKLRCGLKNEVTEIDEPSRCEYVALLSTPAFCLDEKLKELEDKLELMNKERPQGHDEL